MTLPDTLAALARELAILERKGFTLTDQERRLVNSWRGDGDELFRARRARFKVIPGGRR